MLKMFPLIKLAKKLKVEEQMTDNRTHLFPLIKLAKKLKAVGAIHELPLLGWFPLIKLAKKLKVGVRVIYFAKFNVSIN